MRIRFNFSKGEINYHGTQTKGEPWNKQTIHGWKLRIIDLLQVNPEGGKTCALWYKRFIFYFPSGACWYLDIALLEKELGNDQRTWTNDLEN